MNSLTNYKSVGSGSAPTKRQRQPSMLGTVCGYKLTSYQFKSMHCKAEIEARFDAASSSPKAAQPISVTLKMPVGIVFSQKEEKSPVFVDEVTPGGAADKTGKVSRGDVLTSCSAVVLKAGKEGQFEQEGYGKRPFDNWERVTFDCRGQEFKTVMSALKSNNPRWGFLDVVLVFEKPLTSP